MAKPKNKRYQRKQRELLEQQRAAERAREQARLKKQRCWGLAAVSVLLLILAVVWAADSAAKRTAQGEQKRLAALYQAQAQRKATVVDADLSSGFSQAPGQRQQGRSIAQLTQFAEVQTTQYSGGGSYEPSYPLADGSGSIRQLTDQSGAITDAYAYDAWGNKDEGGTVGSTVNPYRYNSQRLDASGLYHLRARYYSAAMGRFLNHDPLMGDENNPITLHRYLYANADPVNFIDPSGAMSIADVTTTMGIQNSLANIKNNIDVGIYERAKDTLTEDPTTAVANMEIEAQLSLGLTAVSEIAEGLSNFWQTTNRLKPLKGPAFGGFKRGISAEEITNLNHQFGGSVAMTGRHPSSALAQAANRDGFWNKTAAIVREIVGGHMFNDGNKRTAAAIIEVLKQRNKISTGVSAEETKRIIEEVATGQLRDIELIAQRLRGF